MASFDPKNYASQYITVDEVIEIKKAFDYFDRDLGGAIDPKGTSPLMQNSRLPSTPSVLRPRPRPSTR
jgi:Ca2+-binding EF-hand superfamily protein